MVEEDDGNFEVSQFNKQSFEKVQRNFRERLKHPKPAEKKIKEKPKKEIKKELKRVSKKKKKLIKVNTEIPCKEFLSSKVPNKSQGLFNKKRIKTIKPFSIFEKSMKKLMAPKKRAVKKTPKETPTSISRKDFETFGFGVQRLKEIERELNSMNTSKFPDETASIKSKLKDVSQIPILEREMKILRKKISGQYRPKARIKKFNVDADIASLVDVDFNSFLGAIKYALSQRVKAREEELDKMLNDDLRNREEKYRQRQVALITEFNKKRRQIQQELESKYEKDVRINLQKEVAEKFNKQLREALEKEKEKLLKQYKEDLNRHVQEHTQKKEKDILGKYQQIYDRKFKHLESEEAKLEKEEEKLKMSEEKFNLHKDREREKIRKQVMKDFHDALNKEVANKTKNLKSQLREDFENKFKKKLDEQEQDLHKKLKEVLR